MEIQLFRLFHRFKTSFVLPLICFIVIAVFGYRAQHIYGT